MGLFELFFESFNPGPVGEMKYNRKKPKLPNDFVILARLILSSGIIWVLFKGFFNGLGKTPLNLGTVFVFSGWHFSILFGWVFFNSQAGLV